MCRPRRDRSFDFSYEQRHSPIQVSPVKPTKYPTHQWDRLAFGVDFDIKRIGMLLKKSLPPPGLCLGVVHQFLKADPCFHAVSLSSNPQELVEETDQVFPDEVVDNEGAKKRGGDERVLDGDRLEQDQASLGDGQEA